MRVIHTLLPFLIHAGAFSIPGEHSSNVEEILLSILRRECDKHGGPTAYDNAVQSLKNSRSCIQSVVNTTQLQAELAHDSEPRVELDAVFKKYCRKVPDIRICGMNFMRSIKPCVTQDEQKSVDVVSTMMDLTLDFLCYNEGDRLATFAASGGLQCFLSKQQALENCANETIGRQHSDEDPIMLIGKYCGDKKEFQDCLVKVMEECRDPTPATIMNDLVNSVFKVLPCDTVLGT